MRNRYLMRLLLLALPVIGIAACSPVGERTQLSVGYYSLSGRSFSEIDRQINVHGPTVGGFGKALAATSVRMVPEFRFVEENGRCKVGSAHVKVQAHVTLPRLANGGSLKRDLSKAWTNLEEYARLHESVHVSIADRHALNAERILVALPAERDCTAMRSSAQLTWRLLLASHEKEQLQFDENEKSRIADLVEKTRHADLAPATQ
ncbi:MAG: DUF922 domain-containing protein [Nitratireductor sp.]|nr:DUF922 domain-containing protein [Nitratireductor sp.]